MKSLAVLVASLSLAFTSVGQVMADTDGGAKGLFFEQLEHPTDSLNTGIQYWIELHHDGKTIHATNKTAFHTGDKIRFHIRPNIDGYAYIMLRSGSRGEQAVLFPEKERNEDNKITRGKEMVLPNDGMLGFDENPGVEKLTLLISRTPIDTDAYMAGGSEAAKPRMIAMSSSGSKDLIPNQVLVSYLPPSATSSVPEAVKVAAAKQSAATPGKPAKAKPVAASAEKPAKPAAPAKPPRYNHKLANNPRSAHPVTLAKGSDDEVSPVVHIEKDSPLKAGLVTVVYKNPNGVLAADISLEHKD